ncbi:patatin-like phospholipase family protein [Alteribacillus sp. HJP-4]|uniref:patatin-like phospholipase family protein n=1 Tax=Alteribacillus sp. HJP-4 TaxID=2775394 RepID=UPI0035CCD509
MSESRPKIGLALGAGGARGLAHIGVLEVFEKHSIPIDVIGGSSMGALVGSLYAVGHSPETLARFATLFKSRLYVDFTLPKMGLIQGNRIKELIRMLAKKKNFEDLSLPVIAVATDLHSGEAVGIGTGPVADAVRASISIPGVFVPEEWNGLTLVDGGVAERVPANIVRGMGVDLVIAVDVAYYKKEPAIDTIYDVILQSMDIMGRNLTKYKEMDADIIIKPISVYYRSVNYDNSNAIIEAGRLAAEKNICEIKERMHNWKENGHEDN